MSDGGWLGSTSYASIAPVQVVTLGHCHTDIYFSLVGAAPMMLAHEGAGLVAAVGAGVSGFAVGDRVLMSYDSCGPADRAARILR